ncbi:metallophosphoesterase [Ammoniphilus sp. 3BR4]|uniref:metallophosphoesterase n=1 Tax=Ammoniphilus sp. 3BR4 TaxID=3158265 RepID=UPI003464F596
MDTKLISNVDIIGDIHGCYDELILLLDQLGYGEDHGLYRHPQDRLLVFVGDLCDRGPKSLDVLKLVKNLVEAKLAYHCPGNHDDKLLRWCQGRRVQVKHGLETTVEEIERTSNPTETKRWIEAYLKSLPLYLQFDHGDLVVVHAGIRADMIGTNHKRLRDICLYGFPTGKLDHHGLPERDPVIKHYRGKALLVHGHTPIPEPQWEQNVLNIDTGCVFGGALTCFRYPEKTFVEVKALQVYGESKRFQLK